MTLRNAGLFILTTVLCFNVPVSYGFDASEDVAGAADSTYFERYPRSKIDEFSQLDASDYLLALDSPKTVNGLMEIDYSERFAGKLTRITYRASDGEPSELVFNHFRNQLMALSHELLFECHGRECGSSNQWANRIFGLSKLYGPQRYQHYLAAKISTDDGPLLMALYSIQRGNKRVYTQLDLLMPEQGMATKVAANPDTVLAVLKSEGVFSLRNLAFDQNNNLNAEASQRLASVVAALNKSSRLKLYVVGHLAGSDDLDMLKKRSQQRADAVRQVLVDGGIKSERLSAQGVGPLAPIRQDSDDANRISLVVQ